MKTEQEVRDFSPEASSLTVLEQTATFPVLKPELVAPGVQAQKSDRRTGRGTSRQR